MNKQELISMYERISNFSENVSTKKVIANLRQLDEPQAGHAEEAPRYVRNIIARLRELPLHDREVWLKAIMAEFEQDFSHAKWREGYEQGKFEGAWVGEQLKDADKIRRELNRPVVPQFVAEWIEKVGNKLFGLNYDSVPSEIYDWVYGEEGNLKKLHLACAIGYEVEKEKRYTVKITKTKQYLYSRDNDFYFVTYVRPDDNPHNCHTRKELEEAGFGWVFDCEGIEVEEVEG